MLRFLLAPFSKVCDLLKHVFLRSMVTIYFKKSIFGIFYFTTLDFLWSALLQEYMDHFRMSSLDLTVHIFYSLSSGTSGEFWLATSPRHSFRVSNFHISRSINTCPLQLNCHDEIRLFGLSKFFLPLCNFPPKFLYFEVSDLVTSYL
jgi:hypothetical protein